jgi:hypothetical protein
VALIDLRWNFSNIDVSFVVVMGRPAP